MKLTVFLEIGNNPKRALGGKKIAMRSLNLMREKKNIVALVCVVKIVCCLGKTKYLISEYL